MDEQQPPSPRARLQALLAIPERVRTDAQWDEINELEISLASGNRPGAPDQRLRNAPAFGNQRDQRGGQPGGGGGGGQHRGQRQGRKFHRGAPRRNGGR